MAAQAISFADLGGIPAQPPPRQQQSRGLDFSDLGGIAASSVQPPSAPAPPLTATQRILGAHPLDDTLNVVGTHLKNLIAGPYHAATDAPRNTEERVASKLGVGALPLDRMLVQPTVNAVRDAFRLRSAGGPQASLTAPSTYDAQGNNVPTAGSKLIDAIPLYGPWSRNAEDEAHNKGYVPALAGLGTDLLAPEAVGNAGLVTRDLPNIARRSLTSGTDTTIPGTITTPRNRYQAAQRLGVNLDAADATGSTLLQNVKRINEHSTFAAPTYDRARTANVKAVGNATDELLDKMSPHDRTTGGMIIQNDLKQDHANLKGNAQAGFEDLTRATGGSPVPGAADLGMTAKRLAAEQEKYYSQFPSLRPSRTMSVLDDVSSLAPEDPTTGKLAPKEPATWSTMHRLGSDLHGIYANNPDIVQTRANGWLQQLVGQNGDAIRDASTGLTPAQRTVFENANSAWGDMKGTYDSPTSPYYSAVRPLGAGGVDPATLTTGFGPKTPAFVNDLQRRLSPEAIGAVQRGVTEQTLGASPGGDYNFQTFPRKFRALPDDYAGELFGDHALRLNDIADTTHAMNRDFNPSGSGKLNLRSAELGEGMAALGGAFVGHPAPLLTTGIYHGLQYGAARLMNSPAVVNWLMDAPPPAASLLKTGIARPLAQSLQLGAPLIGPTAAASRLLTSIPQPAAPPPLKRLPERR